MTAAVRPPEIEIGRARRAEKVFQLVPALHVRTFTAAEIPVEMGQADGERPKYQGQIETVFSGSVLFQA